jgi:hypothetical protein
MMPDKPAIDATPANPSPNPTRHCRDDVAVHLAAFDDEGLSQRQFAAQHDLPRSTLRHWLARKADLDTDPVVAAFLESPQGLAFVHRLITAAHLVFTQQGPCGIRLVCHFLRLSHLDRVVAAAYGSQQKVTAALEQALVDFGQQERQRLAAAMAPQTITVCEDETFHPEICLVAIEPASNFLLVEQYAEGRDAATWTAALTEALAGFPVTVVQAVGDEAKALAAHAREGLGVPHGPDLFHVQYELCRGTAGALAAQTRQAERRLAEAQAHTAKWSAQQAEAAQKPRGPGRPVDYPLWIQVAQRSEHAAAKRLAVAQGRQERMRGAIRGLGTDYHPFDLTTGAPQSAEQVQQRLEARFATIEQLATEAELPEHCRARIAKARRVLGGLVAALAFFWVRVRARVACWPSALGGVWQESLLAGAYLRRASGKVAKAAGRAALRAVAETCLAQAVAPAGVSPAAWAEAEVAACSCATWFQRSSSCVEGRNGQLELRHHSLHRLGKRKLAALTVLHNYWLKRADGTTAAERFFGSKPADLFEWLLERMELPARPARRRNKAA